MLKKNIDLEPTPVFWQLLKMIPFEPVKKRKKAYKKEFMLPYGRLIITAFETLNSFDLRVYIALMMSFTKESVFVATLSPENEIESVAVNIGIRRLMNKYLHMTNMSNKAYKLVMDSIFRLANVSIVAETKEGNVEFDRLIYDIDAQNWNLNIKIKYKTYIALFRKEKYKIFTISNTYIQKTKSYIATIFMFFLMGEPIQKTYSLSFLCQILHLENSFRSGHITRDIIKALEELKNIGFLNTYEIDKRIDDTYLIVEKKQDLSRLKVVKIKLPEPSSVNYPPLIEDGDFLGKRLKK